MITNYPKYMELDPLEESTLNTLLSLRMSSAIKIKGVRDQSKRVFPKDFKIDRESYEQNQNRYIECIKGIVWQKVLNAGLALIYESQCEHKMDCYVLIDRCPPSPGILGGCPLCGADGEISQPNRIYDNFHRRELSQNDLEFVEVKISDREDLYLDILASEFIYEGKSFKDEI